MNSDRHFLLVIGDAHSRIDECVYATRSAEVSIQLGDLGCDYRGLSKVDPQQHKIIAGNLDNYSSEEVLELSVERMEREHLNWRYTFGTEGGLLHLT